MAKGLQKHLEFRWTKFQSKSNSANDRFQRMAQSAAAEPGRYPVLNNSIFPFQNFSTCIFNSGNVLSSASLSINEKASFRATSRSLASLIIFAILRSGIPACLVPKNSPGPLIIRSSSAILNPSLLLTIISSLCLASSPLGSYASRKQYDWLPPRPTLPRS